MGGMQQMAVYMDMGQLRGNDWIILAIAKGTCIAEMNGSYMRDLYPHILCGGGLISGGISRGV